MGISAVETTGNQEEQTTDSCNHMPGRGDKSNRKATCYRIPWVFGSGNVGTSGTGLGGVLWAACMVG